MTRTEFTTTEFLLAAFLQVRRHELIEVVPNPNGDGRVTFIFRDNDRIGQDNQDFVRDGLVPVRSLSRQIAKLRDAVRELKDRQRRSRNPHERQRQS